MLVSQNLDGFRDFYENTKDKAKDEAQGWTSVYCNLNSKKMRMARIVHVAYATTMVRAGAAFQFDSQKSISILQSLSQRS